MTKRFLLALDQGTSSSRAVVFDTQGQVVAMAQQALDPHYPQPGWVEHDAMDIWRGQLATAQEALRRAGISAQQVAALGITNQRETTVLWDRRSGEPIAPAIVWQDRRTEPACAALRAAGWAERIRDRTGLVVDAYFSATKIQWLLDHVPGARARAERGELAFGTVDSWLLWRLTGGAVHATDVTNASRTLLWDIHTSRWDEALLQALAIPPQVLPEVRPSAGHFGHTDPALLGAAVPVAAMAGDQQCALAGQAIFAPGLAKNTYGTGCFALLHTGGQPRASAHGLLTTRAAQTGTQPAQYALEGSVFVAGALIQWLRDGLGIIRDSREVEALARQVPDAGGVVLVPAFTGLGAPYWQPQARGTITGLTRGSTAAHIARAALEAIACQSAALLQAMQRDVAAAGGTPLAELRVDGGACVNDLLMQFQADVLGMPVVRPRVTETTALGAAFLAGLGAGLYAGAEELAALWQPERRFEPQAPREQAAEWMQRWEHAVRQATLE